MHGRHSGLAGMVGVALCCGAVLADDVGTVRSGRGVESERDARISLEAGAILEMNGFVQETTRALYSVTGNTYKNDTASRYDLDDFDVNGGYAVIGLSAEKAWKYITLGGKVLFMQPSADSVSQRNYYIEVDNVSFNGVEFDHLKIPEGTPFSAEMDAWIIELQFLVTPVSFYMNDTTRFTPWLGIGVFGIIGDYSIDVGSATGVTQYQNPPQDFVIGGHANGDLAGGLPEVLAGGELVFGAEGVTHYVLQSTVGWLDYNGSSSLFTTEDEVYDKNADISLLHLQLKAAVEVPLQSGPVISFGAQYETLDTSGSLKQTATTNEEILARQERFDKDLDFYMSMATAFVGVQF